MAKWPCFICDAETHDMEHQEVNGFRRGSNPWVCAKHVAELIQSWRSLFPGTGFVSTEEGLLLNWEELKAIEDRFERDIPLCYQRYTVTDKESWMGRYLTAEERNK